ncbi:hypothetical protein BDR26DRAFT_584119 [Obelidium mucronatum]|nr:hypothetical protein BDR26DRAFT_584119 [Obelidium mucronatum]
MWRNVGTIHHPCCFCRSKLVHDQRSPPLSLRVISRLLAIHRLLAVISGAASPGDLIVGLIMDSQAYGSQDRSWWGGCHWRIPGHVMVTPFSLLALILAVLCL